MISLNPRIAAFICRVIVIIEPTLCASAAPRVYRDRLPFKPRYITNFRRYTGRDSGVGLHALVRLHHLSMPIQRHDLLSVLEQNPLLQSAYRRLSLCTRVSVTSPATPWRCQHPLLSVPTTRDCNRAVGLGCRFVWPCQNAALPLLAVPDRVAPHPYCCVSSPQYPWCKIPNSTK